MRKYFAMLYFFSLTYAFEINAQTSTTVTSSSEKWCGVCVYQDFDCSRSNIEMFRKNCETSVNRVDTYASASKIPVIFKQVFKKSEFEFSKVSDQCTKVFYDFAGHGPYDGVRKDIEGCFDNVDQCTNMDFYSPSCSTFSSLSKAQSMASDLAKKYPTKTISIVANQCKGSMLTSTGAEVCQSKVEYKLVDGVVTVDFKPCHTAGSPCVFSTAQSASDNDYKCRDQADGKIKVQKCILDTSNGAMKFENANEYGGKAGKWTSAK